MKMVATFALLVLSIFLRIRETSADVMCDVKFSERQIMMVDIDNGDETYTASVLEVICNDVYTTNGQQTFTPWPLFLESCPWGSSWNGDAGYCESCPSGCYSKSPGKCVCYGMNDKGVYGSYTATPTKKCSRWDPKIMQSADRCTEASPLRYAFQSSTGFGNSQLILPKISCPGLTFNITAGMPSAMLLPAVQKDQLYQLLRLSTAAGLESMSAINEEFITSGADNHLSVLFMSEVVRQGVQQTVGPSLAQIQSQCEVQLNTFLDYDFNALNGNRPARGDVIPSFSPVCVIDDMSNISAEVAQVLAELDNIQNTNVTCTDGVPGSTGSSTAASSGSSESSSGSSGERRLEELPPGEITVDDILRSWEKLEGKSKRPLFSIENALRRERAHQVLSGIQKRALAADLTSTLTQATGLDQMGLMALIAQITGLSTAAIMSAPPQEVLATLAQKCEVLLNSTESNSTSSNEVTVCQIVTEQQASVPNSPMAGTEAGGNTTAEEGGDGATTTTAPYVDDSNAGSGGGGNSTSGAAPFTAQQLLDALKANSNLTEAEIEGTVAEWSDKTFATDPKGLETDVAMQCAALEASAFDPSSTSAILCKAFAAALAALMPEGSNTGGQGGNTGSNGTYPGGPGTGDYGSGVMNDDYYTLSDGMSCYKMRDIISAKTRNALQRAFIFSGRDTWAGCKSFLDQWVIYGYQTLSDLTTDKCVVQMYDDDGNINAAWESDPCCNYLKRREQCCAPRKVTQTAKVVLDVNQSNIALYSAATQSGTLALNVAMTFASMETAASASCFAPFKAFWSKTNDVWSVVSKCYKDVQGSWSSTYNKMIGNKCVTDADCYTGQCSAPKSSSGSRGNSGNSGTKYCAVPQDLAGADYATPVLTCMVDKSPAEVGEELAYHMGLPANAKPADIAQVFSGMEGLFNYHCMGGYDSYSLTTEQDCLASTACNWNSMVSDTDSCLNPCSSDASCPSYCTENGDWEVSRFPYCSGPYDYTMYNDCYGSSSMNASASWQDQQRQITACLDAKCAQKCTKDGECAVWSAQVYDCIFPLMSFSEQKQSSCTSECTEDGGPNPQAPKQCLLKLDPTQSNDQTCNSLGSGYIESHYTWPQNWDYSKGMPPPDYCVVRQYQAQDGKPYFPPSLFGDLCLPKCEAEMSSCLYNSDACYRWVPELSNSVQGVCYDRYNNFWSNFSSCLYNKQSTATGVALLNAESDCVQESGLGADSVFQAYKCDQCSGPWSSDDGRTIKCARALDDTACRWNDNVTKQPVSQPCSTSCLTSLCTQLYEDCKTSGMSDTECFNSAQALNQCRGCSSFLKCNSKCKSSSCDSFGSAAETTENCAGCDFFASCYPGSNCYGDASCAWPNTNSSYETTTPPPDAGTDANATETAAPPDATTDANATETTAPPDANATETTAPPDANATETTAAPDATPDANATATTAAPDAAPDANATATTATPDANATTVPNRRLDADKGLTEIERTAEPYNYATDRRHQSKSQAKDQALGLWYRAQQLNNEANMVEAKIALLAQKMDPKSAAFTNLVDSLSDLEKRYELIAQGHREALDALQRFKTPEEESELPYMPLLGFRQQATQVYSDRRLESSEITTVDLSCKGSDCTTQEAACTSFVTGRSEAAKQKLSTIVVNHTFAAPPWMDQQQMCSSIDNICYVGYDAMEQYILESAKTLDSAPWVSSDCSYGQECTDDQCAGCAPEANATEKCDWCCSCRNDTTGYYAAKKQNSYDKCGIYKDTVNAVRAKKGSGSTDQYIWYYETLFAGQGGCGHNLPWGTPASDLNASLCADPDNMKVFAMSRKWNPGSLNTEDSCNQKSCDVNPLITKQEDCAVLSQCTGGQCAYCETKEYYNYETAKTKVSCSLTDATGRSLSETLCNQACTDNLASNCQYVKDNVSAVEFCLAQPDKRCSGSVTLKDQKSTKATFNQLSCSDFSLNQCGWAKSYFSEKMSCDIIQLQCKNKPDCEKAGQCDYSYMSYNAQQANGLCVMPSNFTSSDPFQGDNSYSSCSQMGGSYMSFGCALTVQDATTCTSQGAKWFPFAYTASDCEIPGYAWAQQNGKYQGGTMMCCLDWSGDGNDFTCNSWSQDGTKEKCEACNGAWSPIFPFRQMSSWVSGSWTQVHKWQERRVDSRNQWSKTLEQSKVTDLWQDIVNAVRVVPMKNFIKCRLNPTLDSLIAVASRKQPEPVLGSVPVLPGSNSVSTVGDFVIDVNPDSVTGNKKVELVLGLDSALSAAAATTPSGTERLLAASQAITDLPSSCYTKVVQSGKKIGQLIGDCLDFKPSRALSAAVDLCLPVKSTIAINSAFTVDAMATKQANGTYSVYATTVRRSKDGLTICGAIKETNTYCPVRRYADYTSAQVTSADDSCGVIAAVAQAVQQKAAALVQSGNVQVAGLVQKASYIPAKTVSGGASFSSSGQVTNYTDFVAQSSKSEAVIISAPVAPGANSSASTTKPTSQTVGTTGAAPGTTVTGGTGGTTGGSGGTTGKPTTTTVNYVSPGSSTTTTAGPKVPASVSSLAQRQQLRLPAMSLVIFVLKMVLNLL